MDDDTASNIRVVPPLLRKEVFALHPTKGDYIHGYMLNSGFAVNVMAWPDSVPTFRSVSFGTGGAKRR